MIQTEFSDRILTVSFNRAERRNAITAAMYADLAQAFQRAHDDAAVRVVVIQGDAGCFTSGNDLEDFIANPPRGEDMPVFRFLRAISTCPKPVVAAVAGPAVGIGTTLLLHCDLVIAADNARFSVPFVPLGLCPEAGSSLLLPQLLGWKRAAEMLLLGEPLDAPAALAQGLVNRVVAPAELLAAAQALAARLAALPAASVRESKRLMKLDLAPAIAQRMAEEGKIFAQRLHSPEAREAFSAFMGRRKADFSTFD